jgi:glutamyl-Q tRNA(Asp) synthetase
MKSRKSRNTAKPASQYTGRFAPSPTGPLHLGSLISALASYLDARHLDGRWLLRMEDLDPPREQRGAATVILESLELHGLSADAPVLWQSQRHAAYTDTARDLLATGAAFRCDCSRARLAGLGGIYDGHCRHRALDEHSNSAVRVAVPRYTRISISDGIQPTLIQQLDTALGDFVIVRRDGLFAYQLAVVLDDALQGVTQVVRGSDLYDSTPRQAYLYQLLGLTAPQWAHIPVLTNAQGQKLSKQTHAPALDNSRAPHNLRLALRFLRQPEPPGRPGTCEAILRWAAQHWQRQAIPALAAVPAADSF